MARKTISAKIIDQASDRYDSLRGINGTLDLGNGITLATFRATIDEARAKESSYQEQLSILEEKHTAFEDAKQAVADMYTRALAAVVAKYGKDSVEYSQAGGVRSRDRKRRSTKAKTVNQ